MSPPVSHQPPLAPAVHLGEGAPRRRRGKLWVIVVLAVVLGCIGTAGLGGGLVMLVTGGAAEPVTAQERALLLTVDDIRPYLTTPLGEPSTESAERRAHFDGAVEMTYEFECTSPLSPLFLQSGVDVARTARDARYTYAGLELGMGLGLGLEGGEVRREDHPELLHWGDESNSALLVDDQGPVGNYFIARKGSRVFHLVVAGVFFDDPATFQELVQPHLRALEGYETP